MIEEPKILRIAQEVASANLSSSASIANITSKPFIDSEGHDALRITIVLRPGGLDRIEGDATLDTLIQIQRKLQEAGEDRFPLVEYATEGEIEDGGDS